MHTTVRADRPEQQQQLNGQPPADPGYTLGEWVEQQVTHYQSLGTDAGLLVAERLTDLALDIRFTQAVTPADLEAKLELWGRWIGHR